MPNEFFTDKRKDKGQLGLRPREYADNFNSTKPIHSTDIDKLTAVFDEDLDPNDPLWNKIGYNQKELTELLSKEQMPTGISVPELVDAIKKITIIKD